LIGNSCDERLPFFRVVPGCPGDDVGLRHKNVGVLCKGAIINTFPFLAAPAGHAPLQANRALGTGQAIGTHTGTGRQYADAIKASIGADRLARILHMGMGSRAFWQAKSGTGLPT